MMESLKVEKYMNHHPVTFTADMGVEEASLRFLKTQQIGGPVVDDKGKLIGFLSESDVLSKMLEAIYYNEHIIKVADLMRADVLSMKPQDSIIELGRLMVQSKPKVYPVIDDDNNLLGSICRTDVLRGIDTILRENLKSGKAKASQ